MKMWKKTICTLLALAMMLTCLAACGSKDPDPVNTKTCTYDEMVAYLTAKGYIAKGTTPVNINTTEGYVKDNTGGELPFVEIADRAEDYGGLWLFWWDLENPTANIDSYNSMSINSGAMTYMGGAAVIMSEAHSGAFSIAFAEGYEKADDVLADFNALPND